MLGTIWSESNTTMLEKGAAVMESTFNLGTLLGFFFLGALVGVIVTRFLLKNDSDSASLKKKLEELKADHVAYQDSVNQHFSRTADLIETLNHNYKEIQTHLMHGAEQLVSPEYQLESRMAESLEATDVAANGDDEPQVPRDYAPKNPDQEGTLSEGFGLKVEDLQQKA